MPPRNERKTEDLIRSHFKADLSVSDLRIEEQASADLTIQKALKSASKHGSGVGKPEFLVTCDAANGLVVVVECKADPKQHESANLNCPKDYAVDGALHYARHLAKDFDVIAIGASGQSKADLTVTTYRHFKGQGEPDLLRDEHGTIERLIAFSEYARLRRFDPNVRRRTHAELLTFSRELHNYMRDYAKLAEAEKPLLVSGILIALQDRAFSKSHDQFIARELSEALLQAMERVIKAADIPTDKRRVMIQPYQFVETHAVINKVDTSHLMSPLQKMVRDIDEHVRPFLADYHDVDVLGQFYGEFLRYSGGDGKGLGIVLTPKHVGELFARITNIKATDTALDICTGTAGFLIAAMAEMDRKAGSDDELRARIRARGLVGIEQRPDMFSLAAANMMLRGDGKANLHQGSCFDPAITKSLIEPDLERHERPNVGFINPPYSQKGEGLDELSFIKHMLDCLISNGIGVAIVPISCAIQSSKSKEAILADHTLLAVMSMPEELFYPVGTVTCIMVFKAHQPHIDEAAGTWFGYWKNDGHVKTKKEGRVDLNDAWAVIRNGWLDNFHNRREIPGQSVVRKVTAAEEWCAEAYMQTDYSKLGAADFEAVIKRYTLYCLDAGVRPIPPSARPDDAQPEDQAA
ncbi:MAG: N-6 DNA methylase [Solirubrobacteraceae bacterium]